MSVIPELWKTLSLDIGARCVAQNAKLSAAESCTGGLIAAALTSVSGSSAWFDRGFATYSNEAKIAMLGVSIAALETHGAVSEQTAEAMAIGALAHSNATIAFSVTGVAGPSGGSALKPVGMVCFGFATSNGARTSTQYFKGDRDLVREQSVEFVLRALIEMLKS